MSADRGAPVRRLRIHVRGAVQGVGFRPFVYRLARSYQLHGFVRNDSEGVLCEVEGDNPHQLLAPLRSEAPALARISAIDFAEIAPRGEDGFSVLDSAGGRPQTHLVADAATCEACLNDLFDPASRFHLYPFVTCTACGPRFTVSRGLPYDRAQTSMAAFAMCADCARDYRDPDNRRFHAETVACPHCGPRLSHPPAEIAAALRAGGIVALKGIGGFHLLCDAGNPQAIARLRARKRRDAKPFAVMVVNVASAERIAKVDAASRALLLEPSRPIVLLPSRGVLPANVAPGLTSVGIMLAYAPVHHLLFHAALGAPRDDHWRTAPVDIALVATSGNASGDLLVIDNGEAERRLTAIADLVVTHDRDIVERADDSVTTLIDGAPTLLRRARGIVPEPIQLAEDGPSVIALGALGKATVTITRGCEAFVSQHIGDLDDAATARAFHEVATRLTAALDVSLAAAACDLHRDYYSTLYAEQLGLPVYRAQHHAAHIAAVAAEHRLPGAVLGAALDGYGLGADGESWGGELMVVDGHRWQRLGHLAPLPLPGGDRAAREPWRMAIAALARLDRLHQAERCLPLAPDVARIAQLLPAERAQTTSLGRLFDAAAGLCGTRMVQDYEGQAAMELEALVETPRALAGGFELTGGVLDFSPLLGALADGVSPRQGAEMLHGTLIAGLADWIAAAAVQRNAASVALTGGCMVNRVLADGLARALRDRSITPLFARAVPANDGGLSLGQAAMALSALRAGAIAMGDEPCV